MGHKKSDLKGDFEPLPDGMYPAVLDEVVLDLASDNAKKYGPRLALTFKFPNKRLAWINLSENRQGQLNGAWRNLKRLGIGREVTEALGEEYETVEFLEVALKHVEPLIGHYFELELKLFEGNDKQYASVEDVSSETYYDNFKMPAFAKKTAAETSAPPRTDTTDEIPF